MQPREVVDGRFEIVFEAGAGGMGVVYRARDRNTDSPVALKVLKAGLGDEPNERFLRETRILGAVRHPNVVRMIGHGLTADGRPYLAMEWLDGEDLKVALRRGPFSVEQALAVCEQVAEALGLAHSLGIVHRDVKPANIIWLGGQPNAMIKLLDFGVARSSLFDNALTGTGMVMGTPSYLAPEQAEGARAARPQSDVFALGCVLFELVTGRRLFSGQDLLAVLAKIVLDPPPRLEDHRPDAPVGLSRLFARFVAKKLEDRPADGIEAAREIAALRAELGLIAVPRVRSTRADGPGDTDTPHFDDTAETRTSTWIMAARGPDRRSSVAPAGAALTKYEQRSVSVVIATLDRQKTEKSVAAEFEREVSRLVSPMNVTVKQLADDSIVIVSSGDAAATDQAVRAARCALAIRQVTRWDRLVIATGRALMHQAMPTGEAIDKAVSLLHQNRSEFITIDAVTAGLLDSRFEVAINEGFELRDEREGIGIRPALGRTSPFVGRNRELSQLEGDFEACIEEQMARAVCVTAPAGGGKSRLIHEFLSNIERKYPDAFDLWFARAEPISAHSPFGVLAQLIRSTAGMTKGESKPVQRARLEARLTRTLRADRRELVQLFLGEILRIGATSTTREDLVAARADARVMADQTLQAWEEFMSAECAARPVLLLVEDLHWGDAASIRFLDSVLRRLEQAPLFVLATARPELGQQYPELWSGRSVTRVSLGPLSPRACAELIRRTLPNDISAEISSMLASQSNGIPFFLEELIRAQLTKTSEEIPNTIVAMLEARIGNLASSSRQLLRAASVFGQTFWLSGVRHLLGDVSVDATTEMLSSLIAEDLVLASPQSRFENEREYVFRHALLRDTAYAMLIADDRKLGHSLAADWLSKAGERDPAVLAEHLVRGGSVIRAGRAFVEAARHALDAGDYTVAMKHCDNAMGLAIPSDIAGGALAVLAIGKYRTANLRESFQLALQAMKSIEVGSEWWFRALGIAISSSYGLGERSELLRLCSLIMTTTPLPDCEEIQLLTAAEAAVLELRLGLDVALDRVNWVVEKCRNRAAPLPHLEVRLAEFAALHALARGDFAGYASMVAQARAWCLRAGDIRGATIQEANAGFAAMQLGQFEKSVEASASAYDSIMKNGWWPLACATALNHGFALALTNQFVAGERTIAAAIESAMDRSLLSLVCTGYVYLSRAQRLAGRFVEAEQSARSALESQAIDQPTSGYAFAALADALLVRGMAAEALENASHAMSILTKLGGVEEGESFIRVVFVEAMLAAGRVEEAMAELDRAIESLNTRGMKIHDTEAREAFLTRWPEHQRLHQRIAARTFD